MITRIMEQVLVIGSGITGALTASILRNKLPNTSRIGIWDKANGAGGRMSTSRGPKELNSTVDLGAQFISATPQTYQTHKSFYDELLSNGVLQPLTEKLEGTLGSPDTKHFFTPAGISTLVKYYLNKSEAEIKFGQLVRNIDRQDKKWTVSTEGGTSSQFDCVVVTIPVPQILGLSGSVRGIVDSQPEIKRRLEKVEYSSRFALGMFYKPGTVIDIPWKTKDFLDDPCLRLVSIDNRKRGVESADVGPSVCVHTSVPFTLQHLEEDAESVCKTYILPRVLQLVPQLPKADGFKYHKWRYSQVYKSYEGNPAAVMLHDQPLLVVGGDAFTGHSGFDMCVDSALKLSEEVINHHKKISNP